MPGFAFPAASPVGLSSPPYRSALPASDLRYYAPLRLPSACIGSLPFRSLPDTLPAPLLRALLSARSRRDALRLRQDVVHPVAPIPGLRARKQTALPSSRATPLRTCPVLRPRWCPARSPVMLAGLPPSVTRRTSAFPPRSEVILRDLRVRWQFRRFRNGPQSGSRNPLSTTIEISGLNHAAYALVTPGFRRPLTVSPRVRY